MRVGRYVRGLAGLVRYGKPIGVHGSAQVIVQGTFAFGHRVSIGRNSIIQVAHGSKLVIGDGVYIGREVEVTTASGIDIGNFVSVQDRCQFLGDINIGAHCIFAPNVFMSSGTHHFKENPAWIIRDQDALVGVPGYEGGGRRSLPIEVGEDCWFGINAVVMRGVVIGRGTVIGANAVVTSSVDPYSIVAGTPARVIGRRLEFSPPRTISSTVAEHLPYFYSGFDLRQQTIASRPSGLIARGRFELALQCGGADRVHLDVESNQPLTLAYRHHREALGSGPSRIQFPLEGVGYRALLAMEARDMRGRACKIGVLRASSES